MKQEGEEKIIFSIDEIVDVVGQKLIPLVKTHKIFVFQGKLGAGKTTMIKTFFKLCGVEEIVTSPTFTYVKSYKSSDRKKFHHFDLYRLNSLEEFLTLGFDEYLLEEGTISVVEWPEIIDGFLKNISDSTKICCIELRYVEGEIYKREMIIR
jgi:tRNA threonylcarbamoyladenosine biosynthesis protein TsaE